MLSNDIYFSIEMSSMEKRIDNQMNWNSRRKIQKRREVKGSAVKPLQKIMWVSRRS